MNVFLLEHESAITGERSLEEIHEDIPSLLLGLSKRIEGLQKHVVAFYSIQEWVVGEASAPCRRYGISLVDGKLVASPG